MVLLQAYALKQLLHYKIERMRFIYRYRKAVRCRVMSRDLQFGRKHVQPSLFIQRTFSLVVEGSPIYETG